MKFDFSDISYSEITGISLLRPPVFGSSAERLDSASGRSYANKFLDTVLGHSTETSEKRDPITDFYSDLAASTKKEKNISNQQNTADRHGRT